MGQPRGENATIKDVNLRELVVVVPLIGLSLFLGIYPKPVLDRIEPTVQQRIVNLEQKTDYREPRPHDFARTTVKGKTYQQVAKQAQAEAK